MFEHPLGPCVCINGRIKNVWYTYIAKYLLVSNRGNKPLCYFANIVLNNPINVSMKKQKIGKNHNNFKRKHFNPLFYTSHFSSNLKSKKSCTAA